MTAQNAAPLGAAPAGATMFQFKNSRVSMNELMLLEYEPSRLREALARHAARLPSLFAQMPVVLNLEKLPAELTPALDQLVSLCREAGLNPIGLRSGGRYSLEQMYAVQMADFGSSKRVSNESEASEAASASANIASLSGAANTESEPEPKPEPESEPKPEPAAEAAEPAAPESSASQTRIITTPVRSGQQIYARGGDLIVLSSVGAGAEVMADGNVHIYGPLRGRAMAGVSGNTEARVFCQSLEAELISIAGYFKACEDLQSEHWQQPAQAYLSGTRLETAPL